MSKAFGGQKAGFWGGLFNQGPTRERFSIEELRHLHDLLLRNPAVTDSNRETVVEALRSIAELMIWGDQHEPRFFEFFLENGLLGHFNKILEDRESRTGEVGKQVLQTLSILIQNIRSQTAIFYLFSNNHINDIVGLRFDFEDDEVLGYYINLLKTISLKLNDSTVQFFFHIDGEHSAFPLYTEAIKLINHRDGMVRAAVRTLTLSVYNLQDGAVQHFVSSQPASNYFTELAIYIAEQCQTLDRMMSSMGASTSSGAAYQIDTALADIEDMLSYCNDILLTGVPAIKRQLLQRLWESFLGPVVFWPLLDGQSSGQGPGQKPAAPHIPNGNSQLQRFSASGGQAVVGRVCGLCVLERLVQVLTHTELLSSLVTALLVGCPSVPSSPGWCHSVPSDDGNSQQVYDRHARVATRDEMDRRAYGPFQLPPAVVAALRAEPAAFREAFLALLRSDTPDLAAVALAVLVAVVLHPSLSPDILDAAGLLPYKRKKNREILEALTADAGADSHKAPPPAANAAQSKPVLEHVISDDTASMHSISLSRNSSAAAADIAAHSEQGNGRPSKAGSLQPIATSRPLGSHPVTWESDSPASRTSSLGFQVHGAEVIGCLCGCLLLPALPAVALWAAGWLLLQLVPCAARSAPDLAPPYRQQLARALQAASDTLTTEFRGMWCDALPALICAEWERSAPRLISSAARPAATAVQTWLQACETQQLADPAGWEAAWQAGGGSRGPVSSSAVAAQQACFVVQRFVALAQITQGMQSVGGAVSAEPPHLEHVDAEVLRVVEVREGAAIQLGEALPCFVAFAKGQERSVYFALEGLPATRVPSLTLDGSDPEGIPSSAAMVRAVPVVVLADPGPRLHTGTVLSVASMMGAEPTIDQSHRRWLHIHVRPAVRGLLKVLKGSTITTMWGAIGKQLVDGHWVLAFADAEKAQVAKQLVDMHAAKLRAFYCDALVPLTQLHLEARPDSW